MQQQQKVCWIFSPSLRSARQERHAACLLFPRKPVEPVMRMPLFLKYPGILASSIVPATLFFRLFSVFLFLCMREGSIRERKQEARGEG